MSDGWLTQSPGYFALGYDCYVGIDGVPVWSIKGETMAEVAAGAVRWVQDAIEVEGTRTARIYYVTDEGRVDRTAGPDIEILTRGGLDGR